MSDEGNQMKGLFEKVNELQNEKFSLEEKLGFVRNKRHELERCEDQLTAQYQQAADRNTKMLETLKVARHKVDQMQNQTRALEAAIDMKRSAVAALNTEILEVNSQKNLVRRKFENECDCMAFKLLEAKQFYSQEHLEEITRLLKRNKDRGDMEKLEVEETESLLEAMKITATKAVEEEKLSDLPGPESQHEIISALYEEINILLTKKENASATSDALEKEYQVILDKKEDLLAVNTTLDRRIDSLRTENNKN